MVDVRKIIIIFVIAVLYAVLVFSVIEAVYPRPEYSDFCKNDYRPKPFIDGNRDNVTCEEIDVPTEYVDSCSDNNGRIEYEYDSKGCIVGYECNTCMAEYDKSSEKHDRYVFYISAIFALIAIFIGLYLPAEKNTLNEWMGTGFMLGGAFALFFGTATSFGSLDRLVRPIVILLELVLVVFVSYRKIGNLKKEKEDSSEK